MFGAQAARGALQREELQVCPVPLQPRMQVDGSVERRCEATMNETAVTRWLRRRLPGHEWLLKTRRDDREATVECAGVRGLCNACFVDYFWWRPWAVWFMHVSM